MTDDYFEDDLEEPTPTPIYLWQDFKEAIEMFSAVRGEVEVWIGEELVYDSGVVLVEGLIVQVKLRQPTESREGR